MVDEWVATSSNEKSERRNGAWRIASATEERPGQRVDGAGGPDGDESRGPGARAPCSEAPMP